jgi:hypothetical protein
MKYGDRKSMAPALRDVLADYAKLPKAERKPKSVEGKVMPCAAPPPGGLVLTIFDRVLGRDEKGTVRLPQGRDLGGDRPHAPHGQRSSLWLTKEEWQSLVPKAPRKGQTYAVPANLAKRIFLYGLWPHSLWVVTHSWRPDSVRSGELRLTVEEATEKELRLRIHGDVVLSAKAGHIKYPTGKIIKEVENRYDGRIEGVLVYDRTKKQFTRWDMVSLGDYIGTWFAGNEGWKLGTPEAPLALGFAFQLDQSDYEVPAERRRPKSFVHSYIFRDREAFYWSPEKWEADWKKRR